MGTQAPEIPFVTNGVHLPAATRRSLDSGAFSSQNQQRRLLDGLHTVRDDINRTAGRLVVDEQAYDQPQLQLCKYTLRREGVNYQMTLIQVECGPIVVFSWYHTPHRTRLRRILGLFAAHQDPEHPKIKYKLQFYAATVNNVDLQQWFTYLLSGLRCSFKPSSKNGVVPKYS